MEGLKMIINWSYNKIVIQFENQDSDKEKSVMGNGIELLKNIIALQQKKEG